jgi:hypothetical protein
LLGHLQFTRERFSAAVKSGESRGVGGLPAFTTLN